MDGGGGIVGWDEGEFEDIRPLVSGAKGRLALENGDLDAGLIWAGQVQGLIHDIPTCKDLIERIVGDAKQILSERLVGMIGKTHAQTISMGNRWECRGPAGE